MADPSVGEVAAGSGVEAAMGQDAFRAAVEHSLDGVLITIPDGRILYANPAACALLGATAEEIMRRGRQGFTPAADPRWESALDQRARTGRTKLVGPMIRRDGSRFLAEVTSAIFVGEEGQPRSVVIFRDVTARVRLGQRSAALHAVTAALLADQDTGEVLTLVARQARALLEASDAAIVTPTSEPGHVRVAAVDGPGMSDLSGRRYPPGGLAARVMETREGLLVENLTVMAATEDGRNLGLGPGMVVPILAGERVFGALMVGAQPGSRPYGPADLDDIRMFAEAAGVALAMGEARSEVERQQRRTTEQLQNALDSRVIIEQAKGFIAASRGVSPQAAFEWMRSQARRRGENLHKVAAEVVGRTIQV